MNDMNTYIIEQITSLRHVLHACGEISGQEKQTKEVLQRFLQEYTSLEILDCGEGFYAAHREGTGNGIAFRADYDALALPGGGAAHLCGHDGHAAVLCGLALMIEGKAVGRDVFLLFQPAEETGAGAMPCTELFQKEDITEIYGAHNLPGFTFGQAYTKTGTFACGSVGMIVKFHGKPTHAAYPENGLSPAHAVGELLAYVSRPAISDNYTGMVLCTVIGAHMGEKAFGAAAADAEVWLTVRSEHGSDLKLLRKSIMRIARNLAEADGLEFEIEEMDAFPATENDPDCVNKVIERCNGKTLMTPMRWSEDFGHYLMKCKGAFFGIGAGEDCPALHTDNYEYPDELLGPSMQIFYKLI